MKTAINFESKIPDYEQLFQEGTEKSKGKKMGGILKLLLKQNNTRLIATTVFLILKDLPSLMIPLVTAEVINTISAGEDGAMQKVLLLGLIIICLLAPNFPINVLLTRFSSRLQRTVSAGFRNTLIRKLQHLSITYHNEIESGKIHAKFLRDIEAIELLNARLINGVLPVLISTIVSIVVAVSKSWRVTLFFAVLIPVNIITI